MRPEEVVRKVTIYNTGEVIPIRGRMDCKTMGFLYLVWSLKDPTVQYLGRCSRQVWVRLGEHRRDIMKNTKGRAVAEHFARLRSKVRDFKFIPFLKIRSTDPHVIIELEKKYINKYNLVATGINTIL